MSRRSQNAQRLKRLARERAPIYVEPVDALLDEDFDAEAEVRRLALGTSSGVYARRRQEL